MPSLIRKFHLSITISIVFMFIIPLFILGSDTKLVNSDEKHRSLKQYGTKHVTASVGQSEWTIDSEVIVTNEILIVNVGIIVTETGNLILRNVILEYSNEDTVFVIHLAAGGRLEIYNSSLIPSGNMRLQFSVDNNGNLTIVHSLIKNLKGVSEEGYGTPGIDVIGGECRIVNSTLRGVGSMLYYNNGTNLLMENSVLEMTVSELNYYNIVLGVWHGNGGEVLNCTFLTICISGKIWGGISIWESQNFLFSRNVIGTSESPFLDSIVIHDSSSVILIENIVYAWNFGLSLDWNERIQVLANIFSSFQSTAVISRGNAQVSFINNSISGSMGLLLVNTKSAIIYENKIQSVTPFAVSVDWTEGEDRTPYYNHDIKDNLLNGYPMLYFFNQSNRMIVNFTGSTIFITMSQNITIQSTNLTKGLLQLSYSNNCVIEESTFYSHFTSIRLEGASFNTFRLNEFRDNGYNVWIEGPARGNFFYQNNFFGGWIHEDSFRKQNHWNDSDSGNYWSDYEGTDDDQDGIGDQAYYVSWLSVDFFPMMEPYPIHSEEKDLVNITSTTSGSSSVSSESSNFSVLGVILSLIFIVGFIFISRIKRYHFKNN